jgi:hypothetical protein
VDALFSTAFVTGGLDPAQESDWWLSWMRLQMSQIVATDSPVSIVEATVAQSAVLASGRQW